MNQYVSWSRTALVKREKQADIGVFLLTALSWGSRVCVWKDGGATDLLFCDDKVEGV